MRALEPAVADGVLAAADKVVGSQGDSHARGSLVVVIFPVAAVGALACVERHGDVIEPPRCPAETLQRGGGLLLAQRRLEVDARFLPLPSGQRPPAGREGIDSLIANDTHGVSPWCIRTEHALRSDRLSP